MKKIILPILLFITLYTTAQVGIGTKIPEPSAMLEVKSNSKGVLISRMTESERSAIKSPASGLLVYQTDGSAGFYYHTGSEWKYLPPAAIASAAQPINSLTTTTTTSSVASVAGTTNRITSSGGTAPVIDIASTYVGQPSITTLGTIGTGTWNGTVISSIKGGAGSVNGLLKANGSGTVSAAVSGTDYLKPNAAITAGTKIKLTYNAQGLVTGGSDASTTDIAEGNNKYYTDSRSRAALSLTTLGTSGAATYNKTTGVLNIPQYSGGSGGTTYSFASPLALNTGTVSIPQANSVTSGYLSSTDWNTFNNKLSTATAASTYAPIASPTFTGTVNGITKSMVGLSNVDNTSDLNKVISTATQTALDNKLTGNTAITGATKTKITYDSKGLVTSGTDATTTDIAEGTNLYFTEQRALNTVLSGFVAGPTSPVLTSDDIVSAFGKLQAQINKYDSLIDLLNKRIDSLSNTTPADSSNTVNLTKGLVAYYPFTGNAGDSSGNGNHGTVNGATLTTDRFGNANKAYNFDGIDNYIQTLNPGPSGTGITISYWYKSGQTDEQVGVLWYGGAGAGEYLGIKHNSSPSGQNICYGPSVSNHFNLLSRGFDSIPDSTVWHHVVYVLPVNCSSINDERFILDNTELQQICSSATYASFNINIGTANPIKIGHPSWDPNPVHKYFRGKLDDIRIYNRVLTQAEISLLASDTLSISSSLPVLTTTAISDTTATSASSGGNITSAGGTSITARGIVWGTSSNPTISLSTKTTDGTGTGSYSSQITGLTASTTYYVRAYATNTAGTAYGNEVSFTTNSINLTNGLVAYYPFTGNAGDSSGNGNHGTVNGATLTTDRFGNANKAYSFNNNTISVPHKSYFGFSDTSKFSVSLWASHPINTNNFHFIGFRQPGAQTSFWQVYSVPSGIAFQSWDANGTMLGVYSPYSPGEPLINTWYNIVAIYESGNWKLFVNGVLKISKTTNVIFPNDVNQQLTIGNSGGFEPFYGQLDDVRIYNRALTQAEISLLASDTVKTNSIPNSVTIGTQIWTDKNLDVSTYRNGDIIPQVTDNATWASLTKGAWCYYNNDSTNYAKYGKLYNWYAVIDSRGLAPEGWHIPSDTEWANLGTYLGGKSVAGGKMKEVGIINWSSPNTDATNETGFTGLPGGIRIGVGTFNGINSFGNWWSSTQNDASTAWGSSLSFNYANLGVHEGSGSDKQDGFSIRCIRD